MHCWLNFLTVVFRAMNLLEHYRRRSDSLSSDRRLYSELSSPRDVVPLGRMLCDHYKSDVISLCVSEPAEPAFVYPHYPDIPTNLSPARKPLKYLNR